MSPNPALSINSTRYTGKHELNIIFPPKLALIWKFPRGSVRYQNNEVIIAFRGGRYPAFWLISSCCYFGLDSQPADYLQSSVLQVGLIARRPSVALYDSCLIPLVEKFPLPP